MAINYERLSYGELQKRISDLERHYELALSLIRDRDAEIEALKAEIARMKDEVISQ